MVKNGITYRIIFDDLGSVRSVVSLVDATEAQRIEYGEFGNVRLDTNPGFQPFGFAGGLYDLVTNFLRFGSRDYAPAVGRWTIKDPIRFRGGDPNLYRYVLDDPINLGDLYGEALFLYGNYCGPGNNGGQPIDDLDAACKVHDDCYSAAGLNWKDIVVGPPSGPAACAKQAKCDADLCAAAKRVTPGSAKGSAARAAVIAIFCTPAPSCNPPGCL